SQHPRHFGKYLLHFDTHELDQRYRPDLAALARTCKIFKEPALDALWRSQHTLDNILRLLPSNAWSHIIRRIEQREWKIPLTYSRRVRSLSLF
ncbi:hypothetical protein GGX14DRAFT_488260, partial [Mycena pura]